MCFILNNNYSILTALFIKIKALIISTHYEALVNTGFIIYEAYFPHECSLICDL